MPSTSACHAAWRASGTVRVGKPERHRDARRGCDVFAQRRESTQRRQVDGESLLCECGACAQLPCRHAEGEAAARGIGVEGAVAFEGIEQQCRHGRCVLARQCLQKGGQRPEQFVAGVRVECCSSGFGNGPIAGFTGVLRLSASENRMPQQVAEVRPAGRMRETLAAGLRRGEYPGHQQRTQGMAVRRPAAPMQASAAMRQG